MGLTTGAKSTKNGVSKMSDNTKIEWCDSTFNPWLGCTKVGPGCDNCYAKADFDDRRHRVVWGAGQPRSRTKTWGDPVRWNKTNFYECSVCGWRGSDKDDEFSRPKKGCIHILSPARQRVFCASLADVFDNAVDSQWRDDLFDLIKATPNLDWLLLTKRIGNVGNMLPVPFDFDKHYPNVWIGATVVNQTEADRDIPKLLAVPAAKRFLSMEPLLGPVDIRHFIDYDPVYENQAKRDICVPVRDQRGFGNSVGRDNLEASKAGVGSLAREGSQSPMRTNESGARQWGVFSGSGHAEWKESNRFGASDGVASLQQGNTGRIDSEPLQRDQEGQFTKEPRIGDISGTATTCDAHSESGSCWESGGDGQQHGKTDHGAGASYQGEALEAGATEGDCSGLRSGVSDHLENRTRRQAINQVIVGGESGPKARPMHPDWARSLRDQCDAAGVAFMFKQWGNWRPAAWFDGPDADNDVGDDFIDLDRTNHQFLAADGRTWDTFGGQYMYPPMPLDHWCLMVNEGKKAAGRLLDGREWNGVPA